MKNLILVLVLSLWISQTIQAAEAKDLWSFLKARRGLKIRGRQKYRHLDSGQAVNPK